jgi:AcrR family transcriptional regulator
MAANLDPRARRTRERLVAAYRELAADRGHDSVTVSDLVDRAGVNRTSFYAHFAGTDELAAEALTEFFEVLASADATSRRSGKQAPSDVSEESLSEVVRFVFDRRSVYAALLRRPDGFARAVEDAFADSSLRTLRAGGQVADPEVTARFIAAGVMGVLGWWLADDHGWTPQRLAKELTRIIPADFTRPPAQ